MKLRVSSPTHSDFELLPVLPAEYADDTVPGSEISYAEGEFGKVVLQKISSEPFNILYNFYDIQEKCILQFNGEAPPLRIVVALKGAVHFKMEGGDEIHLKQGQFNFLYSPYINTRAIFEQAGEALIFNLYLPAGVLQELAPVFPLQEFIQATEQPQPQRLFQKHGWITAEIIREINHLLNMQISEALRPFLFDIKVKQILHLLLLQKFHFGKEPINEDMLEKIRETRHTIETTVGEMFTIEQVSRLSGIAEYDLKKYFRQVVGMGLSSFIIRARLHNARLLIQETDLSIKEIAYLSGYDHEQNFIQAFKKYFDYTPFFVRQKNRIG